MNLLNRCRTDQWLKSIILPDSHIHYYGFSTTQRVFFTINASFVKYTIKILNQYISSNLQMTISVESKFYKCHKPGNMNISLKNKFKCIRKCQFFSFPFSRGLRCFHAKHSTEGHSGTNYHRSLVSIVVTVSLPPDTLLIPFVDMKAKYNQVQGW